MATIGDADPIIPIANALQRVSSYQPADDVANLVAAWRREESPAA